MNTLHWQKIEELFNTVLTLPPDQRESFLDSACDGDANLRAEVDSLLNEVDGPEEFLSESGFALGAQLLSSEHAESLAGQVLGSYSIIRRIGRGGMGEVYLAHDERLSRRVAIKLLPKTLVEDKERARRFKHEARATSAISHPNVAHIYEIGESQGRLFIAMEFVNGPTLRDRLSRNDLTLGETVEMATQVALAIAAAHGQGVIHRDIKPENIMLTRDGLVKVVDFGLAKLFEPERTPLNSDSRETQMGGHVTRVVHTEPGLLMGTATYMSPEQARGQNIDARTDIWSWGVVFYEMLAGEPPFCGATNSDVIAEILKSEPLLLRPESAGLPPAIREILQGALSKDRESRYAKSADIVSKLRELQRELEVQGLLETRVPLSSIPQSAEGQDQTALRGDQVHTPGPAQTAGLSPVARTDGPELSDSRRSRILKATRKVFASPWLLSAMAIASIALTFAIYSMVKKRTASAHAAFEIVHVTNDGRVMDAAISPDGRLLAYVPIASGKQSLRVRDLASGESWELLPPDPALCWRIRFALNNLSLFYVTKQPESTVSVLYRMPVRGGPSQKLVVNIDSPPGLSPDGMQLAFIRRYPGQHRDALVVVNVDGSQEREILARAFPDRLSLAGVGWSSDGKLIAVGATRHDETEAAILGVPVNGSSPIEITPWQFLAIRGVVWRDDGRTILFSAQLPGSNASHISRVSYPEKQIAVVTSDENQYEEATLAANILVATHTYELSDLWLMDQDGTTRRLTSDGHNGADGLTVTSSGRVVHTVGEYAASQLWTMNPDGNDRKQLTTNYGIHASSSKDGQEIAYVSTKGGSHHIWLVNIDGQNNHQLTFGGGENYPSLTPDGKWVLYISRAKDGGTLWKIPAAGGQSVQLTFAGIILNPVVSPDGKRVACTYRTDETDRWKIAVLPIDGGEPVKTFAVPSPFYQIIRWTADSQAFTYLDKQAGAQNVWRHPLDGSAPQQITHLSEDLILNYDWLGKQMILARGGRRRDIVLMKNFD
jgi:serine/threonine protein kinase/Tol biopolymer transport system component